LGFTVDEVANAVTGTADEYLAFRAEVGRRSQASESINWVDNINGGLTTMRGMSTEAEQRQRDLAAAQVAVGVETDAAAGAVDGYTAAQGTGQRVGKTYREMIKRLDDAIKDQVDSVLANRDAQRAVRDAHLATIAAQEDLTAAQADA